MTTYIGTSSAVAAAFSSGKARIGGSQAGGVQQARRMRSRGVHWRRIAAARAWISSGVGSRTIRRSLVAFLTIGQTSINVRSCRRHPPVEAESSPLSDCASSLCPMVYYARCRFMGRRKTKKCIRTQPPPRECIRPLRAPKPLGCHRTLRTCRWPCPGWREGRGGLRLRFVSVPTRQRASPQAVLSVQSATVEQHWELTGQSPRLTSCLG